MKRDARDTPKSVTLGFEDDCVTLPLRRDPAAPRPRQVREIEP